MVVWRCLILMVKPTNKGRVCRRHQWWLAAVEQAVLLLWEVAWPRRAAEERIVLLV